MNADTYRYMSFCMSHHRCIYILHNRFCKYPNRYTYNYRYSFPNNLLSNCQSNRNDSPFRTHLPSIQQAFETAQWHLKWEGRLLPPF